MVVDGFYYSASRALALQLIATDPLSEEAYAVEGWTEDLPVSCEGRAAAGWTGWASPASATRI